MDLARELAAIRLALGEMPTRDYLAEELEDLRAEVQRLRSRRELDKDVDRTSVENSGRASKS